MVRGWVTVVVMSVPSGVLSGPHALAFAVGVAGRVHARQLDAVGAPYMGHVNRVMAYAELFRGLLDLHLDRFSVAVVAALHDVVEDSDMTLGQLAASGLASDLVSSLDLLTHRRNAPRREYLAAIVADPLARVVKLADTWDNADPRRLSQVGDPVRRSRLEGKYRDAFAVLQGVPLPGSAPRFFSR